MFTQSLSLLFPVTIRTLVFLSVVVPQFMFSGQLLCINFVYLMYLLFSWIYKYVQGCPVTPLEIFAFLCCIQFYHLKSWLVQLLFLFVGFEIYKNTEFIIKWLWTFFDILSCRLSSRNAFPTSIHMGRMDSVSILK